MPPKGEAATAARPAFRARSDCRCEAALSIACRGSFASSELYEPVTETAGGILGVQCTPQAYFYSLVSHQFPGLGLLVDGGAARGRTQGAQKRGRKGEEQTFTSRVNAGVVKGAVFLAVLFEGQMEERLQTPSTAVQRPWKPA